MAILSYDIGVTGLKSIDAAFAHVERRARASNRMLMQGAMAAQARGRQAAASGMAGGASARAARAQAMTEEQMRAEVARRGAALREKLAARTAARIAKIEASMAAKTEAEKTALAKQAEMARVRHAERLARIEAASKARMAAATAREELRIKARARAREMAAERAEAAQKLAVARRVNMAAVAEKRALAGTVGRAAIGSVASIGRSAIGAAALAGTALLGSAVYTQSAETVKASQLANQLGDPSRKQEILAKAQGFTGYTGGEVLDSLKAWTEKTGDVEAGLEMMRELSQLSLATGANLEDMGRSAGAMFNPIRDAIKDPEERIKALTRTLRMFAGAGQLGTVELESMATEGAAFAAQASRFQGGPELTMMQLNAAAQSAVARGGAENAAEASTALARFGSDIIAKGDKLKSNLGVDIYTDKSRTQMKGYQQLVSEVVGKSKGRLDVIGDIFGERGARIVQGFQPIWAQAEREKKGTGDAAVQAEFSKWINAKLLDTQVAERAGSRTQDLDIQLKETMKLLNAEIGREFMPIMLDLAKSAREAVPAVVEMGKGAASVARWFTENPLRGIGTVIAAKVTYDITSAAIGQAVQQAIVAQITAAAGVSAAGTAGTAAAAGAGAAGKVGAAGAAGAGAGVGAIGAAGAAALAGIASAGYEAYALYGNWTDNSGKGGKQIGADDWTVGSTADTLLTAGLFSALGTFIGEKTGGASWGESATAAGKQFTPVKLAEWFFGEAAFKGQLPSDIPMGKAAATDESVAHGHRVSGEGAAPVSGGDQLSKPAQELTAAAKALTDAAKAQSGVNRGPSPSPVK